MSTPLPENLMYTATHEWIALNDDGSITVGITDHAQSLLGDIVYVQLPAEGRVCRAQEEIAVVESVKTAADVYTPIQGKIIKVNETLQTQPERINQDPYQQGWLFTLQPEQPDDLTQLWSAKTYQAAITEA